MKRTGISILLALMFMGFCSCIKDKAPDPSLKVTLEKTEYKAGEPVTFRFEGTPDNIVFYSGEYGHNYSDRNNYGRVGTLYFDFRSFVRYGTIARNIRVLVSTDFSGIYDMENIAAATWMDMTDRFILSEGLDNVDSGVLDINSFITDENGSLDSDDDIYIAFHYVDYTDEDRTIQNEWIIRSSDLEIVSPAGERSVLADMETFGWTGIPKVDITKARIRFYDHDKTTSQSDDWAISKAFSIGGIPADTGVALKNISTSMSEYTYTYSEPGIYTAVFETSSVWYTGGSSSVTEVEVVVTE